MTQLDFFEKIDTQLAKELPFVVYKKPKSHKVQVIFQKSDCLHFLDNYEEVGFVFAPFQSENSSILLKMDEAFELSDFQPESFEKNMTNSFEEGQEERNFHLNLVRKGIAGIEAGNFDKVVLSRCLKVSCHESPFALFQKLLSTYSNAFCYLWYHPKVGLWLGATPEILLMVRNQQLTTMSLAGTQPYVGVDDPVWGNKEIEEQELVTDYITDALNNKINSLSRTSVETVRAGNLMHLRTKISGSIKKDGLVAIIKSLHPTPAVCGLPKDITQEFILKSENYNREFYTGYLGELNFKSERQRNSRSANQENQVYKSISNTTTLFVNLRCMQLKNGAAHIYVGGGITKDSEPEMEWEETVSKSKTMLRILYVLGLG